MEESEKHKGGKSERKQDVREHSLIQYPDEDVRVENSMRWKRRGGDWSLVHHGKSPGSVVLKARASSSCNSSLLFPGSQRMLLV